MSRESLFVRAFPALEGTGFSITSPRDERYNCIAWAAGHNEIWWEPVDSMTTAGKPMGGYFWPEGATRAYTLQAFTEAFETIGYLVCATGAHEPGFEKVAIFVNNAGAPTHAVRELADGRWASKLGHEEDIEHDLAEDVSGSAYGQVAIFMRRPN